MTSQETLNRKEWEVRACAMKDARSLVVEHHYSKGCSNTAVYTHGLFNKRSGELLGVAWWLPPTRVCAESVNRAHWTRVLSLSRLVCHPSCPKNSASFLIGGSISIIRNDRKYASLVTYADEYQNHEGGIYKATNWEYVGKSKPYQKWVDGNGRQVSKKSTVSRTNDQMRDLGHKCIGNFAKHKFVMHVDRSRAP